MQLRATTLVWAAATLFAAGTAAGWATPELMKTFNSSPEPSGVTRPGATEINHQGEPVPPANAPNYREIVARNKAAVVGISTVSESKTTGAPRFEGPFEWSPFGNPDEDPFFRFFRGIP